MKRIGWRGALGIALSVGLLWWALHDVSFDEVRTHLRATNMPLMVLAAIIATFTFPVRALRWRVILAPVDEHLQLGLLWRATAIGMALNNVVPLRAGEVARAYVLARESRRVSFSLSFASLAVDRLFDALAVLLLVSVAILDPAFPTRLDGGGPNVANWAGSFTLFAVAGFAVLYAIVFFPGRLISIYEWAVRRVAPRFEARGREILLAFAEGLGVLRRPAQFALVTAWAVGMWTLNAFAFWVAFRAVGFEVPFTAALLVQGIIAFGIALPSAPGFFGLFEGAAIIGLSIYGIDRAAAVTWAITFHVLSFIPITVIGLYYFARMHLRLGELDRVSAERAP